MEPWVAKVAEPLLADSKTCWQPSDFLPDPTAPDFLDAVRQLQHECAHLPPEFLIVLIGDMVTEEALPSYMSMLNRMDGTSDDTGGAPGAWARWNRAWTSEENRHGDLLNKYLYLSGQVNMRAVEASIQRLIGTGFDPVLHSDPYRCFVYTSFQERATKISHRNTARLADEHGAAPLASVCWTIAGDEARHEAAYQKIVEEFLKRDADGALQAFAAMMDTSIVMPAHLMQDNVGGDGGAEAVIPGRNGAPPESQFFRDYAALADSLGVYTASDYADILDHLVRRWRIADLSGLSGEGAAAQEYLIDHASRIRRIANVHQERRERQRRRGAVTTMHSTWVYGRELVMQ